MADTQSDIIARGRIFIQELMSAPMPLPLLSACAVAGNGWQENLLKPVTIGAKDHGSDGVMQWRLGRLTELEHLPEWETLQVQARFFKTECQRPQYARLWTDLVAGKKSLETLTANVMVQYERPNLAVAGLDHRITYAHALFDHMNTLPKIATPSSAAAPNIAAASIGGTLVALAPLLQYLLKDVPTSHILMTVGTGIAMLAASLVINRKPPVLVPTPIPEPLPQAPIYATKDGVPDKPPATLTTVPLSSIDQLKALIAQRAAIDAQIAQLQPVVQAAMAEMADLLGKIPAPLLN